MEDALFFHIFILSILISTSTAIDTITANQNLTDSRNNTIVSADGVFELGFFSPGGSKNRYLGIWYKNISTGTVVWVANRQSPLADRSGVLNISPSGNLVLMDGEDTIVWSANSSSGSVAHPVAQLYDSGNFALKNENETDPESFLWQSFDHPVDHLLPGMKLGWDLVKGLDRHLTSWRSTSDPSEGNFTAAFDRSGYPQLLVWEGLNLQFRFGPWNGLGFSGQSGYSLGTSTEYVVNNNDIYYKYDFENSSLDQMRMVLNPNGTLQLLIWRYHKGVWEIDPSLTSQKDDCDHFALCGAYSSCFLTKSVLGYVTCRCLEGFEPKYPMNWTESDWSEGCVRKVPIYRETDVFIKYEGLKLPDTRRSLFKMGMNFGECEKVCFNNSTCTAFSTDVDIREGGQRSCTLWFNDLIDIRYYGENGQDLFIRLASSSIVTEEHTSRHGRFLLIWVILGAGLAILLSILLLLHVSKKRKLRSQGMLTNPEIDPRNKIEKDDVELPLFVFDKIVKATSNFSRNNKLGEGGFGPVYKGILNDGQQIAVKRLSKSSKQGIDEFKNEVKFIAKLQHRNLVRLLGCCIEEGEMMLIYEYMPNKSLDSFIFDKELSKFLDWTKRYNIINGTAKGLLYLHQDSRLRIIHRDLKASNILLDSDMNPRISDFGLARTFGENESAVNTIRVVGTYGYMPPEYVIDGLFSVKSDVYSFGVVVLEIVSGKKIRSFYHSDHNLNLLGHAWKLHKEGNLLELVDEVIANDCNHSEVFRAVQIGLLCVQPYPKDRPSMSSVVSMLTGENELPQPKEPGFFTERQHEPDYSFKKNGSSLCGELTNTSFAPR